MSSSNSQVRGWPHAAALVIVAITLIGASPNQEIDQSATYEASVQWTEGGVPAHPSR